jgi:hypothetical protein
MSILSSTAASHFALEPVAVFEPIFVIPAPIRPSLYGFPSLIDRLLTSTLVAEIIRQTSVRDVFERAQEIAEAIWEPFFGPAAPPQFHQCNTVCMIHLRLEVLDVPGMASYLQVEVDVRPILSAIGIVLSPQMMSGLGTFVLIHENPDFLVADQIIQVCSSRLLYSC